MDLPWRFRTQPPWPITFRLTLPCGPLLCLSPSCTLSLLGSRVNICGSIGQGWVPIWATRAAVGAVTSARAAAEYTLFRRRTSTVRLDVIVRICLRRTPLQEAARISRRHMVRFSSLDCPPPAPPPRDIRKRGVLFDLNKTKANLLQRNPEFTLRRLIS